ncbi:uncharacterized protein CTRU02_203269 [Colletotrichum truncatum]|uniref:Uncharacterized protein n=1 Tax=Colletotrichum truncatum TaxID=5467 RepID=A0ACC3Z8X6_COLTU
MSGEAPIRVAVVGTGLAGLTTAYLLQSDEKQRYTVTLFEQAETLSFDSASVAVRDERSGVVERIDLPMRALAGGYYTNVMRMYDHLGISYHPIRFLFSFAKTVPRQISTSTSKLHGHGGSEGAGGVQGEYFVHASNLHQIPPWPGSRGVMAHFVEIVYLIVCQFWFTLACFLVQPFTEPDGGETLEAYLERIWLPRRYAAHYLLPLISSVSTCSHAELLRFPASDVVNYKKLTHRQQHYTVCGGVHQVESTLASEMQDVRLGARVVGITPVANGRVKISWQSTRNGVASQMLEDEFDRVILAVSPDVAGKVFEPLRKTLEKIPTTRVESSILRPATATAADRFSVMEDESSHPKACAHHQGSKMPSQVICLRTDFGKETRTEALHTMPGGTVVSTCTLNPAEEMKRQLRTARFTRTLRTTESRAVVQRIMGDETKSKKRADVSDGPAEWVNGEDNVWLTGAWCWDGMVLLEGCLVSAMRIADDFGVKVPW